MKPEEVFNALFKFADDYSEKYSRKLTRMEAMSYIYGYAPRLSIKWAMDIVRTMWVNGKLE